MRNIFACMLILFIVVFAGCKSSTPQAKKAQGKVLDPCVLITKAEAEKLVGESFKDAEKKDNKVVGQKICLYESAKEGSFRLFQISLTQQAYMPGNGQSPKAIYTALKDNFPKAVKVDGIGDDAFIAPPGLHILSGDYYISIAVGNTSNQKNRQILMEAGKNAIASLKKLTGK